jgi:hypothetical protein
MRCAIAILVLGFGLATHAAARTLECGYSVGADHLWYVLCEDLDADPVRDESPRERFWRVPLWSAAPYPDSDPARLVRAVLCPRRSPCEVRFRDGARGGPFVSAREAAGASR